MSREKVSIHNAKYIDDKIFDMQKLIRYVIFLSILHS